MEWWSGGVMERGMRGAGEGVTGNREEEREGRKGGLVFLFPHLKFKGRNTDCH